MYQPRSAVQDSDGQLYFEQRHLRLQLADLQFVVRISRIWTGCLLLDAAEFP